MDAIGYNKIEITKVKSKLISLEIIADKRKPEGVTNAALVILAIAIFKAR